MCVCSVFFFRPFGGGLSFIEKTLCVCSTIVYRHTSCGGGGGGGGEDPVSSGFISTLSVLLEAA